ncbi:MAG: Rieske (2Fe-2S) protein [Reichenbachiella sp.]
MKRRKFIRKTGAICAGSVIGVSFLTSCSKAYYATYSMDQNRIRIAESEFVNRDFVLVSNERLPAPIYIHRDKSGYTAVLLLCTHKECEVAPFGNELHCPCHGSEFSNKGEVLVGPAEKNLNKFKVEVKDQFVFVS